MLDWCQDAHDGKSCLSCTRAGRVCNCRREASSDSRSRAPNRPSVRVGRPLDASPQDVPGRPRRRALTTAPRMLNLVVFVKSLEVVLFCCFLLDSKASHEAGFPVCANSHASSTVVGWMRGGPTGGGPIREASSGGTTTPAGPPGMVGPVPGRPVLRSEIFPTPCRSDPLDGSGRHCWAPG